MITTNTWLGAIFFILAAGFFALMCLPAERMSLAEACARFLTVAFLLCALFLAGYAIPLTLEGLK